MADEADRAGEFIERDLEAAIAAARGVISHPSLESANERAECGELIPSARQIAVPGCQLCAECASEFEHRARLGL